MPFSKKDPQCHKHCAGPGRLGFGAARAACGQRPGGLEEPLGPVAWSWGTATWVHWGYCGILMGDYWGNFIMVYLTLTYTACIYIYIYTGLCVYMYV